MRSFAGFAGARDLGSRTIVAGGAVVVVGIVLKVVGS